MKLWKEDDPPKHAHQLIDPLVDLLEDLLDKKKPSFKGVVQLENSVDLKKYLEPNKADHLDEEEYRRFVISRILYTAHRYGMESEKRLYAEEKKTTELIMRSQELVIKNYLNGKLK